MKYQRITEGQIDRLEAFDPVLRLDRISLPGYVGIAAQQEEADGSETTAGVLLYSQQKQVLTVEWLFVAEQLRLRGIGEKLLGKVFSYAAASGCRFIRAYLPKEPGFLAACPVAEEYLAERYFTVGYPAPGEHQDFLFAIGRSAFFERETALPKERGRLKMLSDYTTARQRQILAELLASPEACVFCAPKGLNEIDPAVSVVCEVRERISGALLVAPMGEDLCMAAFFAEHNDTARALLYKSYRAASKKYVPETRLLSAFREEGFEELFDEFYGAPAEGSIRIADVRECLMDKGIVGNQEV